ncbi:MAG: UDP-N-acetylglucosamine 1-carboxyvinyltransferase [Oscillospiraceae bacterium]|nr:UDP-N-acetylglucosamine 1-carboxyvinyltransferase [Oscillospiraceae bacterium]
MDKFIIRGGARLVGSVPISGAKNAAVAILPAVLVSDGVCTVENVPKISDVAIITQILSEMGAAVELVDEHTLRIDARHVQTCEVPHELSRHMRASYYFLGALLTKFGKARVSLPGGCNLGARPIDQHLKAFASLGCSVNVEYGMVNVDCAHGRLQGARIFFDTVSVGATINAILASVKVEGQTVLENAAKEPHIVDVANFLNSMGADIRGAGTDVIKINGVAFLRGTSYSIIPDQIEAGTYMAAAAATGGDVLIENITPKHLESITSLLLRAGAEIEEYEESLRIRRTGEIHATNVKTMPHPGFPTDMQPQMATLLSLAKGTSIVTESIWDNRFKYVDELRRMGANIQVDGKVAIVEGIEKFTGAPVRATDLRAGAAMIIAGLVADGVTEIEDIYHIERGYEDIVRKLRALGADVRRVTVPDEEIADFA